MTLRVLQTYPGLRTPHGLPDCTNERVWHCLLGSVLSDAWNHSGGDSALLRKFKTHLNRQHQVAERQSQAIEPIELGVSFSSPPRPC